VPGVGALLTLCDRGIVTGGDADELLMLLESVMRARGAAVAHDFTFESDWCRTSRLDPAWLAAHTRHKHQDPSALVLEGQPFGTPYLVKTDTPDGWWDSELLDALHDHGFTDVAIARLYSPFQSDLMIALYRFDGAPTFSEADRETLRLVMPFVARGLASRRALAALQAPDGETLGQALPKLGGSVFVTWPGGEVKWSTKARTQVQSRLGFSVSTWPRANAMIRAAVARFLGSAEGARSQVLPGNLRLELAIVPPGPGETQRLLGWLVDDRPNPSPSTFPTPAEELLSPRQRAVARSAARGRSIARIAVELRLRPETVRTHLREVYRRLGVSQRVELARLVLAS
jgi:DNA-binding CsgD family transcriptional regulator